MCFIQVIQDLKKPSYFCTATGIATIALLSLLLTTPILHTFYHVRSTVTVGEVSGNLFIGIYGYCLEMSKNVSCSYFNRNPILPPEAQVLAQGRTITAFLFASNILSMLGALLAFVHTPFESEPNRYFWPLTTLAAISICTGLIIDGVIFAYAISPKKMGGGFYISLGVALVLVPMVFIVWMKRLKKMIAKLKLDRELSQWPDRESTLVSESEDFEGKLCDTDIDPGSGSDKDSQLVARLPRVATSLPPPTPKLRAPSFSSLLF